VINILLLNYRAAAGIRILVSNKKTGTRKNLMYGYQNLFYSQCHLISLFAHKISFDKAVGFCPPFFLHLRGARKRGGYFLYMTKCCRKNP